MINKIEVVRKVLQDLDALLGFELCNAAEKYEEFIEVICRDSYVLLDIDIPHSKMTKILRCVFPDRDPVKHKKIDKYILSLAGMRECPKCVKVKYLTDFRLNASKSDGVNGHCKVCHYTSIKRTQPSRSAQYKAASIERVMSWSNMEEISAFYSKCPEGYHVDHIIPLQGEVVSGLHVIENLQYLSAEDNIKKHNKFIAG